MWCFIQLVTWDMVLGMLFFKKNPNFNFVQIELNQNPNVQLYNINFKEILNSKQRLMLVAMLWPFNTTDNYELQYMTKHACYMQQHATMYISRYTQGKAVR